ncbi:hypothetical protein JOS77_26350 [Chromobacterium haemolyticum]|nr:hypothetical protein JOS77_26350 [Chromobacterium haemolyticum]
MNSVHLRQLAKMRGELIQATASHIGASEQHAQTGQVVVAGGQGDAFHFQAAGVQLFGCLHAQHGQVRMDAKNVQLINGGRGDGFAWAQQGCQFGDQAHDDSSRWRCKEDATKIRRQAPSKGIRAQ